MNCFKNCCSGDASDTEEMIIEKSNNDKENINNYGFRDILDNNYYNNKDINNIISSRTLNKNTNNLMKENENDNEINSKLNELKREKRLLQLSIDKKQEEFVAVHKEHKEQIAKLERKKTDLEKLNTKLDKLQQKQKTDLEKLKNEFDELKQKYKDLKQEHEIREKDVKDVIDAHNAIVKKKIALKKEKEKITDELNELKKELERLNKEKNELDEANKKAQKEIAELKKEKITLTQGKAKQEMTLTQYVEIKNHLCQMENFKKQEDELEKLIQKNTDENVRLKQLGRECKKERDAMQKAKEELSKELENLKNQINIAKKEYNENIKKNNVGKIYDSYNKGNKKYNSSQNLPIIDNFNLNKTFTEEEINNNP